MAGQVAALQYRLDRRDETAAGHFWPAEVLKRWPVRGKRRERYEYLAAMPKEV